MQENTNKAIAINSLINYAKMGINTILALLTTRFALQALGVNDFGLFSVLGSIITFMGVFNTIMLSTSNRFLAVAIGRGNTIEINKQFNVNVVIYFIIAILMLLLAYPIGVWYINSYINYDGPTAKVVMVFTLSIIGSIFSTIATPYNGLLMAKERFIVFSLVDVLIHLIRCIVAFILIYNFENKLFVYTLTMTVTTSIPVLIYWSYCKFQYADYVRWRFVTDKLAYKEVLSFSGWVGYGAIACIAKNQGASLLVNAFFNTAMNTALGIANSLNAYITLFANCLTQPMQPQITKSYAIGNTERTDELLIISTKFSFMMMFLISIPFFIDAEYLLGLWLGNVPAYATSFTLLLIIDNLVQSFNAGISTIIFASGRIALYQIVINTLRLLSIVIGYFVLRTCINPYALFCIYIVFSIICIFATQWSLKKTLGYNLHNLYKRSYIPCLLIAILGLLLIFLPHTIHPILRILISIIYILISEFFIGLNKKERNMIISKLYRK